MIDRHSRNVVLIMLNSNMARRKTSFYTGLRAGESERDQSIRLQPRHTANEKHARHDNGYGFLGVRLMFYSHAVLKSLYLMLLKMMDECKGRGVYTYMLLFLLHYAFIYSGAFLYSILVWRLLLWFN